MKDSLPHYIPTPSPRRLYLLTRERPSVEKLAQLGKSYEPLLRYILAQPPKQELPTGKALQEALGISPSVFRRWLDAWEADFWDLAQQEDGGFLDFRRTEHVITSYNNYHGFEFCCQLAVTPRVGESVELPFLPGKYWTTYYVDSVRHLYRNGKTVITIVLREGRYNQHLQHLRHKARFEHTYWSVDEKHDLDVTDYFRGLQKPPAPPPAPPVPVSHRSQRGRFGR